MIGSSENRISYNGNGIATEFAYTFKILEKSDIKVLHVAADGTETLLVSDYYVDMEKSVVLYPGYAPGAEIPEQNRPPILPVGERLVLYREVPITQESALDKHWPFNVIENGLDKLTIICQQIWDRLQRSFYVSESTSSNFDPKVPIEAGKTFRVKDDGTGFEVTEDPGKVIDGATALLKQTTEQAVSANEAATNAQNAATSVQKYKALWFDSVAAMKAEPSLTAGAYVCTAGYYEPNDGGGASYLIRAKADSDVDDGGSLHELANGLVAELIVENGTVYAEQFGAKCDGVSDDTTFLKKSVEFCRNGCSLLLGNSKTYLVKVERDKDKVLVPDFDNFVLFGNGATIKISSNGYPYYTIMDIQSTNFYIENLTLVGDADTHDYTTISSTHEHGHGFIIHGNGTLFNCKTSKVTGDGMYLCNNSGRQHDSGMKDGTIRVLHCEVEKSRRNGITVADNDIVILDGCYIHDNGDFDSITGTAPMSGIDVEASYVPTNCLYVRNTRIEDNTSFGFVIGKIESDNTKNSLVFGEMNNCTVADLNSIEVFFVKNTHMFQQHKYISVAFATNCKFEFKNDLFMYTAINCEVIGVGDGQLCLIHTSSSHSVIGCRFTNIALQSLPTFRLHHFINCVFEKCYDRNVNGGYRMDNCTIIDLMPADKSVTGDQYVGHGGNIYFNNCLIINDTVPWWVGATKTGCTEIEGSYVDGLWQQTDVT